MGGRVDLFKLSGEVARRAGDADDAQGSPVPDQALIEFGNGEVEAVTKLVLEGTDDLAAVLERLRMRNSDFERQFPYRHGVSFSASDQMKWLHRRVSYAAISFLPAPRQVFTGR